MLPAIKTHALPESQRSLHPEAFTRVRGVGRDIAVAKLREFADKLESGELDGVRVQWRDDEATESEMVTVTLGAGTVQMLTTKIEEV